MTGLFRIRVSEYSSILKRSSGSGTSHTARRNFLWHRNTDETGRERLEFLPAGWKHSPEPVVCARDVFIERVQVSGVSLEVFERSAVLQDSRDGAQCAPLTRKQSGTHPELHHIKTVWSHDRRIHVAIVDEIPHNLNTNAPSTHRVNDCTSCDEQVRCVNLVELVFSGLWKLLLQCVSQNFSGVTQTVPVLHTHTTSEQNVTQLDIKQKCV